MVVRGGASLGYCLETRSDGRMGYDGDSDEEVATPVEKVGAMIRVGQRIDHEGVGMEVGRLDVRGGALVVAAGYQVTCGVRWDDSDKGSEAIEGDRSSGDDHDEIRSRIGIRSCIEVPSFGY